MATATFSSNFQTKILMDKKENTSGQQTTGKEKESARQNDKQRSDIGATNEKILAFIMQSTPYECDAIRVILNALKEKRGMEQLTFSETTILNRYMNEGLAKDADIKSRIVRKHRQKMVSRLLESLSRFLKYKSSIADAAALLSDFACDDDLVDKYVAHLKSMCSNSANNVAADVLQNGNQGVSQDASRQ